MAAVVLATGRVRRAAGHRAATGERRLGHATVSLVLRPAQRAASLLTWNYATAAGPPSHDHERCRLAPVQVGGSRSDQSFRHDTAISPQLAKDSLSARTVFIGGGTIPKQNAIF